MFKNQKGEVWVPIIIVLVILGIVAFAWWSVSHSKEHTSKILKPAEPVQPEKASQ